MSAQTGISWCDSTFNPWIGCTKVSPACDYCYAARQDAFRKWTPEGWGGPRRRTSASLWKQPEKWNAVEFVQCASCGHRCELREFHAVDAPADWTMCPVCSGSDWHGTRRRVFCASLADAFDNQVPPAWRSNLFELIRVTPNLDWLLLTKRPQNIVRMVRESGSIAGNGTRYLPDNVRLGTTCEDQTRADSNIPALLRTRAELGARSLFISVEPMLEPIKLGFHGHRVGAPDSAIRGVIDWLIVGGESGPHARPMHPDWVRSLRDQCAAARVPFHFKQWGEWGITGQGAATRRVRPLPGNAHVWPDAEMVSWRVGVRAAGRLLDGVEHNGFPA